MENRETIKFTTPLGKREIEIKSWLNGYEKRALTNVYLSDKIEINPDTKQVKGIDAQLLDKGEELAWKLIVVSIDGIKLSESEIVSAILNMRSEDYEFIKAKVNEISADKGISEEKKTI